MAGHNKWSKVKNIKGVVDAKRSKIFSKMSKEITVAARSGGADLSANPRLRQAVENAKSNNMPKDNIERAIKKGTGDLEGVVLEEILYEGFAGGGVGIVVETVTDNKNRTGSEIRTIFSKNNGNLGNSGSVTFLFDRLGEIVVNCEECEEDKFFELIIDAGGNDLVKEDDVFIVYTDAKKLAEVAGVIKENNINIVNQSLIYFPKNKIEVKDQKEFEGINSLIDKLEDYDDTQNVFTNLMQFNN